MSASFSHDRLIVEDLSVEYDGVAVVNGASIETTPASTLGLVGESGSGKSTIAKTIVGLAPVSRGTVTVNGLLVDRPRGRARRQLSKLVQLVFQDPGTALNPRASTSELIEEPLIVHGHGEKTARKKSVHELLNQVELPLTMLAKHQSELSGGQKQRVAIARALAVEPRYLVLDEVTSALDVSVQQTILELLRNIQENLSLGYIFISHDLPVVRQMADEVSVMRSGLIVEHQETDSLFDSPNNEYTRELIDAAPVLRLRSLNQGS